MELPLDTTGSLAPDLTGLVGWLIAIWLVVAIGIIAGQLAQFEFFKFAPTKLRLALGTLTNQSLVAAAASTSFILCLSLTNSTYAGRTYGPWLLGLGYLMYLGAASWLKAQPQSKTRIVAIVRSAGILAVALAIATLVIGLWPLAYPKSSVNPPTNPQGPIWYNN